MFEEYLQDSYEFLSIAEQRTKDGADREARRYFRASVFYASGAIEAFVNYIADSFAQSGSIPKYEISFLNDKSTVFSVDKGLSEKSEYHRLDEKIRLILKRFAADYDFKNVTWVKFMEFKRFRDELVHPRQTDDETPLLDYSKKVRTGLKAIIDIMNTISTEMFGQPLRRQLLDLIPD